MDQATQRPISFVVTVGTSLCRGMTPWWESSKDYSPEWLQLSNEAFLARPDKPERRDDRDRLLDNLEDLAGFPKKFLREQSAELAALYAEGMPQPFGVVDGTARPDRIHLIGTRTEVGEFCVGILKTFLSDRAKEAGFDDAVFVHFPMFLGSATQIEFAKDGLPAFLEECVQIFEQDRATHSVELLPNGGYKTLIGYLSWLGLMRELPIRYVYEDSDVVINFPPLPVGLDISRWRHVRSELAPLEGQPWNGAARGRLRYPHLLERVGEKFAFSPLAQSLEAQFQESRQSELRQMTSNFTLLGNLRNEEGVEFRGMFERLSTVLECFWHADAIPEMVSHGAVHHYDLFEFAEQILVRLLNWPGRPDFLAPCELFALLGAIAMHDCGHVIRHLNGKRLTRDQIRRHHHVLGYLRLKDGAGHEQDASDAVDPMFGGEIYRALMEDAAGPKRPGGKPWKLHRHPWSWDDTWNHFLSAIATLGVYHRREAPLNARDAEKPYKFLASIPGLTDPDGVLLPLMQIEGRFSGTLRIDPRRMRLLACLLRIIDSLDQHAMRAGSEQYVRFHLANLRREVAELNGWLESTRAALPHLVTEFERWESLSDADRDRGYSAWRDGEKDPATRALVEEYVHSLDDRKFKEGQETHFTEKQAIQRVLVRAEESNGSMLFRVHLEIDTEAQEAARDQAHAVGNSMRAEYEKPEVRETLESAGVRFEYSAGTS